MHKLRNLIVHAPPSLAEEINADYTDMIYAKDAKEVEKRRRAFRVSLPVSAALSRHGRQLSLLHRWIRQVERKCPQCRMWTQTT